MTNSAQIRREHLLKLMMDDGLGPDEVADRAAEYAVAITGTKASRTATNTVRRLARGILRDAS